MTITLDRKTVVAIYCYCRQAERSLHRACDPANNWGSLLAYYDAPKRTALGRLVASARGKLPERTGGSAPVPAVPMVSTSIWRIVYGRLFARWRRQWRFTDNELAFVGATLDGLLALLDAPRPPALDAVIACRRQLLDCEMIIEARCPGLDELRDARNIAYFDQSPGGKTLEVSELVPDAA